LPKKKVSQDSRREKKGITINKGTIIFTLVLVIFVYFMVSGFLSYFKTRQQVSRLEEEIEETREKNKELNKEIKRLENDLNYIEEQARGLGMIKEGEKIIEFAPLEGDKE